MTKAVNVLAVSSAHLTGPRESACVVVLCVGVGVLIWWAFFCGQLYGLYERA
jgi:hypothetical protein